MSLQNRKHNSLDLIAGSNTSFIATLVERHSRYVMLVKVPSKDTLTVVNALIKHSKKLPTELYKSLTWDRGCLLYTSPSPRDLSTSRMPSSA